MASRCRSFFAPAVAASTFVLGACFGGSGSDGGEAATEPRTVAAERRPFTSTVTLSGTVDVAPWLNPAAFPPGTPLQFVVTAKVDPVVLYRLPDRPEQATVRIAGGPPEFSCGAVQLVTVPATPPTGGSGGGGGGALAPGELDDELGDGVAPGPSGPSPVPASAETVVRCVVPPDVRVFPGLSGDLVITTARLPDAVVVPTGAVELESGTSGFVTVVGEGGREERRKVQIGPSDGSAVVVTGGLNEGERVLDRVPIRERPPEAGGEGGARVMGAG